MIVGLARACQERRLELGRTLQNVGVRMGYDYRYATTCYYPYERKGVMPRFDVLLRLAAALDLAPDELVRRAIAERPDATT